MPCNCCEMENDLAPSPLPQGKGNLTLKNKALVKNEG